MWSIGMEPENNALLFCVKTFTFPVNVKVMGNKLKKLSLNCYWQNNFL